MLWLLIIVLLLHIHGERQGGGPVDALVIVGGKIALPGEIPYQSEGLAEKQPKDTVYKHICGGVILNKNYVVTACHCVKSPPISEIVVVSGTTNLSEPRFTYTVASKQCHDKHNEITGENDVALIRVNKPFQFNKFVGPITLPNENNGKISKGDRLLVSGFGNEDKNISPINASRLLKKARVKWISEVECSEKYNDQSLLTEERRPVFSVNICTLESTSNDHRKGTCVGDSGGPLTLNNVLVGIISWSSKEKDGNCASPRFPNVYTRVDKFVNWIKRNMHF